MLSVKIFQAFGKGQISEMEEKVNDFLDEHESQNIISVTPQMCSIGHGQDEIYQTMTITVFYRNEDE